MGPDATRRGRGRGARLASASVSVRSSGRSTIRTSALACPGRVPSRSRTGAGSCSCPVTVRTVRLSSSSASAPSAPRARSPSNSPSTSASVTIDRSRLTAGMVDTARHGARSSSCAAIRGSAALSSRMSGMPFRSISARSRPMPSARPLHSPGGRPARDSTCGAASPHSASSTQPSPAGTSTCTPCSVYGCDVGTVRHRAPGSTAGTTVAIRSSRSAGVIGLPRTMRQRSSWCGVPTCSRSIASRRYTSPGSTSSTSRGGAGSPANARSAGGTPAEVWLRSMTVSLT